MKSEEPPSFLLLNPFRLIPLSSNHGKHLLGRFCESMPRPTQKYVPDEPVAPLDADDQVVETVLKNAKITTDVLGQSAVNAKLKDLLKVSYESTTNSEYSLESMWIRTVTIPQQDLALKRICARILAQDGGMERLNSLNRWYMVVSIMTCGTGSISRRLFASRKFGATLNIPLSRALSPQLVIADTLSPDPEIGFEDRRDKEVLVEGDVCEETIIAVEYREVRGPRELWVISRDIMAMEDAQFPRNSPVHHKPSLAVGISASFPDTYGEDNEREKLLVGASHPISHLERRGIRCVGVGEEVFGLSTPKLKWVLGAKVVASDSWQLAAVDDDDDDADDDDDTGDDGDDGNTNDYAD